MQKPTVAVLGAGGTMGIAMARNLTRAGFGVNAWDRSRERAEPLAQDGATLAGTPQEALDGAQILLTMLPDGDVVLEMAERALRDRHDADLIWLQMSTIGEEATSRCLQLAEECAVTLIDAPVSGTKEPAEQGTLVVLASGPRAALERAQPIFDVLGQRTILAGERAGEGSRLKLAVNAWLLSVVEATAESLALTQGLGLDPHLLLGTVAGGPLDLPYLQTKGRAMLDGDFAPSFRLALAAKDAHLVQQAGERRGLDLPLLDAVRRRLEEGAELHGDDDLSATFLTSSPRAAGR